MLYANSYIWEYCKIWSKKLIILSSYSILLQFQFLLIRFFHFSNFFFNSIRFNFVEVHFHLCWRCYYFDDRSEWYFSCQKRKKGTTTKLSKLFNLLNFILFYFFDFLWTTRDIVKHKLSFIEISMKSQLRFIWQLSSKFSSIPALMNVL